LRREERVRTVFKEILGAYLFRFQMKFGNRPFFFKELLSASIATGLHFLYLKKLFDSL